jgi:hypothetical protein
MGGKELNEGCMSRQSFEPTQEQRDVVEATIAFGIPEAQVAQLIKNRQTGKPISEHTLRKHFAAEIAIGATKLKSLVGTLIVNTILGRKNPATGVPLGLTDERTRGQLAMFFAKTRMGWRETVVNEHMGKDGGPIATVGTLVILPDNGRDALRKR